MALSSKNSPAHLSPVRPGAAYLVVLLRTRPGFWSPHPLRRPESTSRERSRFWSFTRAGTPEPAAFIFPPGALIAPEAYAPIAYTLAEAAYKAVIVKLPLRAAPLALHEGAVGDFIQDTIAQDHSIRHWVVGGHSRGGAIAARFAHAYAGLIDGLVLIGTSHPKEAAYELSTCVLPVAKICASQDGLTSEAEIEQTSQYLPVGARFVRIAGGNHAQFGWYGAQLGDEEATINREAQQEIMLKAILEMLRRFD